MPRTTHRLPHRAISLLIIFSIVASLLATVQRLVPIASVKAIGSVETVIDHFEASIGDWAEFQGNGATWSGPTRTTPGAEGSTGALTFTFDTTAGYAGITDDYAVNGRGEQDWSAALGLAFWFKGTGSGLSYRVDVHDNNATNANNVPDTAERIAYSFKDTSSEWRHINAYWTEFSRAGWNPEGAPNDGFTKTEIWGLSFAVPDGASGSFSLDRIALITEQTMVENYDGVTTGTESPFTDGAGSSISFSTSASGKVGNSRKIDYTLSAGSWGGGFTYALPGVDWSNTNTFDFWFKGGGQSAQYRIDLSDNSATPGAEAGTAERFYYYFTETSTDWQLISIPWGAFTRSTNNGQFQPGGAPNDGITLTEVWGMSFVPLKPTSWPASTAFTNSFEVDEIAVVSFAGDGAISLPIVENYETDKSNTEWIPFFGNTGTASVALSTPGKVGDGAMKLTYAANGDYAGVTHDFPVSQNWYSDTLGVPYTGVEFWMKSTNPAVTWRFDLHDNRSVARDATQTTPDDNFPDSAQRWAYNIPAKDYGNWTKVVIPFASFKLSNIYQPEGAPTDGLTLSEVWGYSFAPSGGAGELYVDHMKLVTTSFFPGLPIVDDFELPRPAIVNFNGGASTVSQSLVAGYNGEQAFKFDYTIGDYGGFVHDFALEESQDWSSYEAISLWFKGTNTGHQIRLDIHDNSATPGSNPAGSDTSQRWAYTITDNSTEWRQLVIPFSAFVVSTAYQPTGAPTDSLNLTEMWGYSFSPPVGTGSFTIDDVILYEEVPALTQVGQGSYATGLADVPSDVPVTPSVTDNVTGPVPTNDWWTSLAWHHAGNNYSTNLFAHPLAFKAKGNGIGVDYPNTPVVTANNYWYEYSEDFTLSVDGLAASETKVDGWSDWTVTALWEDAEESLKVTIGHGMPFAFAEATGDKALIIGESTLVVDNTPGPSVIGFTVNGHHYGAFAPASSQWTKDGNTLAAALSGNANYFSIAVLPDTTPETLNAFAAYAYNFVTGGTITWAYDEATSQVNTTYNVTTQAKEGSATGTMFAVYRHQWLNMAPAAINTAYTYASPRGEMKVLTGTSFSTSMTFGGALPILPDRRVYDIPRMHDYIEEVAAEPNLIDSPDQAWNTYWYGKDYHRLGQLALVAELFNKPVEQDLFVNTLKSELEDWFTAEVTETDKLFYHNDEWGTLLGYPDGFQSVTELNDHHFHYGYFILAAASIAKLDPTWAEEQNWGGMVEMLIRDASSPDRSDALFPFLRNFDQYAGHSWANGAQFFTTGNNQESSSEAMMYAYSLIMWGIETGDDQIRDLGIYLYTTEQQAIEQYWFDVDQEVFPAGFDHAALAILWGSGAEYRVWWNTTNAEEFHGINWLPITAGSLYLGREPEYIKRSWDDMLSKIPGGQPRLWHDTLYPYYAMYDADAALAYFNANETQFGTGGAETKAYAYHWLATLADVGQVDPTVTANTPSYAVFVKDGMRTYAAYNPGSTLLTVTFSDGTVLRVLPGKVSSTFVKHVPLVRFGS